MTSMSRHRPSLAADCWEDAVGRKSLSERVADAGTNAIAAKRCSRDTPLRHLSENRGRAEEVPFHELTEGTAARNRLDVHGDPPWIRSPNLVGLDTSECRGNVSFRCVDAQTKQSIPNRRKSGRKCEGADRGEGIPEVRK